MTRNGRAGFGRITLALGMGALLALAGCEKGPDRATVAAELKAGVEAQLKDIEGAGQQKVVSHSAVTVTPQDDDTYLVAIDGLKIQPDTEGYLEIGTLSYRAKPRDEKSYDISDLKIPETMPFKGMDGKDRGKLTMTTKAFSAIWSKELQNFTKLDSEFANVSATDDTGGDVRVASLKFNSELADKGGGVSDAIGSMILAGFAAKDTDNGDFTVGEVRIDGKYDSMKVAEFQTAARTYQEVTMKHMAALEAAVQPEASGQTGTAPAMPPEPSAEDQKALADAIVGMAAAIKGGDFKLALKDLKYTEAGNVPFSMTGFTIGSTLDGINQEKATMTFDIGHDGLAVVSPMVASPVAQATLPKTGSLGLKITNVPSKDLVKVLADNMPGMMSSDPSMAQANGMAMVVAMQAVLQASGAKIEVTPSQLVSQVIEMKADGAFDVTPQAVFGVVGGLNVAIRGIDDLLALAQQTPEDFDAQQAQGAIGMLQEYSAREQGADGKPVDKFKIEVGADGQMLVNGKPM
jgi:hypothetical protein